MYVHAHAPIHTHTHTHTHTLRDQLGKRLRQLRSYRQSIKISNFIKALY